jgi:disulfide bond formation protein DsbB
MGILWLRVSNTMVVGIVGVALAAMFTQGFDDETKIIGYGLLALALGIAIYQLVIVRVHYPSS